MRGLGSGLGLLGGGQLLSVFSPHWRCLGQGPPAFWRQPQTMVIKFRVLQSALKEPVDQAEAITGGSSKGKVIPAPCQTGWGGPSARTGS